MLNPRLQGEMNGGGDAIGSDRAEARVKAAGHQFHIYTNSASFSAALVADIRTATRRVWLDTYIFAADAVGRAIAEAVKERAQAGVDCRLIYDAAANYGVPASFYRGLEQSGVQVHAFRTLRDALSRRAPLRFFNRRDHRKLGIIDDHVAYFGGMNLVDQGEVCRAERAKEPLRPRSAGWRDIHIRLAGPEQARVAEAFEDLWENRHRRRPRPRTDWPLSEMLAAEGDAVFFFDARPQFKSRRPATVLVPLLARARRSITISMAYFIPQGAVLRELYRACDRGVTVRVVLPKESDVPVVAWAARHGYEELLRRGIRLYERLDQMLHSKVLVVDNCWTVAGSCNLDPRSLRINLEFFAVVRSEALASAMNRICAYEIRNSHRVRFSTLRQQSWWQRCRNRVAWMFRNWL